MAMVGAGVTRNPLHCHRFWQQLKGQPVEFTGSPMTASARWQYCAPARPKA
ncbi:hypothetical protein ECZU08_15930 [Escherichia coli]|nr:hypothetical protein ECZU08_15930 [Escherichia coli]